MKEAHKSILWKNRDGKLVTITPDPHKIASIYYSNNSDEDTVRYYDDLAEKAKPSVDYKSVDEIESDLVDEICKKFEEIGIDTSEWEYHFGDGNFAAEFIQVGIKWYLEKLDKDKNVQECDTTESKSISEPLVTNAKAIECYVRLIEKQINRLKGLPESRLVNTVIEDLESVLNKTTLYSSPIGGGMRWDLIESFIKDCLNEKRPSIKNIIEGLKFIAGSVSPVVKDDWISVEDKPNKSGYYLTYDENVFGALRGDDWSGIEVLRYDSYNDSWYWGSDTYHPQFYKPLPKPPKI